ncbi:transferrin-like [Stegodyphus dumicola]|uniref:transferrin-like n=1 Tax=Stegodyphus dumicola TaxID=202533 RepID=UPI0015B152F5|nr:transferrin-like [Stegodyphus dumicola]
MFLLLFGVISIVHSSPVRVCVPDSLAGPCALMARDLPETFACVIAPDMLNCVKKIRDGEADITNADPSALYLGGKFFNLRPLTTELVDGQPFRYQGIALVSKNSDIQSARDLQGRPSCHTGLRRTVGWQIPVGKLLSKNVMRPDCEEGELGAVQKFFNGSCLPGKWSTDPILDSSLSKFNIY